MGIIALDIETMNHPDPENDNQVPTVVTISHLEQLDPTLKLPPVNELFHLNKAI
jgi:DNA polymerase elongation subunit (family B)